MNIKIASCFWSAIVLFSCGQPERRNIDYEQFGEYWFKGKAEITAFDLVQYRYGQPRKGEAVLIFVTEPFSRSQQVKLDDPEKAGNDAQTVMKLNMTKDFVTGIYPYHMMQSVFTPVYEKQLSLKANATSQEWCGQTFSQLNWQNGKYQARLFSYFQQEGELQRTVDGMPESELWNLIRINPQDIPEGEVMMIPDLLEQRMSHTEIQPYKAMINQTRLDNGVSVLRLEYIGYNRDLKIFFDSEFPYAIQRWQEEKELEDGEKEITQATRKGQLYTAYWKQNQEQFRHWRDTLNLGK